MVKPFCVLKPLQGLFFNSQKCNDTFVNWYKVGFQKTDFVVSSAFDAKNNKICFTMRIADRFYSNERDS
jgi:hypothetical protein